MDTTQSKYQQWSVVSLIVVALLAVLYFAFWGGEDTTLIKNQANPTASSTIKERNPRLAVTDQFPGNIVFVTTAETGKAGFVVIERSGTVPTVLGATYVTPGIGPTKVDLNQTTKNAETYRAVLYYDTDGDKKFDITKDLIAKDDKGVEVAKTFRALIDLPEDKG